MTTRLSMTAFEDRMTPAFGLDTSFATDGRFVLSDTVNLTGAALPRVVEPLPDGRLIVGSTATDASGNVDFLVFRLTADGALDTTFGTGGKTTIAFNLGGANTDVLNALTVLADGRVLVAGYAERSAGDTDFAIAQLSADGILDTTFGTGGKTTIAFNRGNLNRDAASAMALDSLGRIVLGGYSESATSGDFDFAVVRLTSTGSLDTSFSTDGKATVSFNLAGGTNEDKAVSVAIGSGNSILLAGSASNSSTGTATALARFQENGNLDTSFNGTGLRTFASVVGGTTVPNAASAAAILADGRIVIAGTTARSLTTNTDWYAARLTSTGSVDTTFGTSGFTTIAFDRGGLNADVANAIAIDSSGRLILAGSVEIGAGNYDFGLARLTSDGRLDTTFQANGLLTVTFDRGGTNADAATDVATLADGAVVVVGVVETRANEFDVGVARLQALQGLPSTLIASGNGSTATTLTINTAGLYSVENTFTPFNSQSLVRSAVADVDGDGVPDAIYVIGPGGGSLIRIVSGATKLDLISVQSAFETSFTGGLFVGAADFDNDGKSELIVSPDVGGGGRVQVFSVTNGALVVRANFFGIDDLNFRGGARVAAGDVNGDGTPDLVVSAGFGGGPRVAVFNGTTLAQTNPTRLVGDFFAFPGDDATRLRNGVFVTVGDVNADGKAELIFGGGPGGGPRVFVLDGNTILTGGSALAQAAPVANFFVAGDSNSRGGIRLAMKDIDGDGRDDLVTASGDGLSARIRIYRGSAFPASGEPTLAQELSLFEGATLASGVFVG